jgi:hypothetical protein
MVLRQDDFNGEEKPTWPRRLRRSEGQTWRTYDTHRADIERMRRSRARTEPATVDLIMAASGLPWHIAAVMPRPRHEQVLIDLLPERNISQTPRRRWRATSCRSRSVPSADVPLRFDVGRAWPFRHPVTTSGAHGLPPH